MKPWIVAAKFGLCVLILLFGSACLGQPLDHSEVDLTPNSTADVVPEQKTKLAVTVDPAQAKLVTLLNEAEEYKQIRQWPKAESAYVQVLEQDQTNPQAILGLASVLLAQERPAEAGKYWQMAIDRDLEPALAWAGLGRTYLQQQAYAAATDAFEQAWRLEPDAQEAVNLNLAALRLPDDLARGRTLLEVVARPETPAAHLLAAVTPFNDQTAQVDIAKTTGIALVQLEEWALAHHALEIATALDPADPQNWAFLGHTQSNLGLAAERSFQTATELAPDLALIPYLSGLHARRQGNLVLALNRFLHGLDLDPNNLALALEAAETLIQQGDYRSAEAWYQAIVQLEPEAPVYQRLLTEFYVNRSYRVAEAGLAEAQKLVALTPADPVAHDLLGWAKYQAGDIAGAEVALRYAIELDQQYLPARYHLGRLLESNNDLEAAQVEFSYVVEHDQAGHFRRQLQNITTIDAK